MKSLRIIPMFLLFTLLSFLGAVFVETNPDMVSVRFLTYETPMTKQGLVVLLTFMVGMVFSGIFCAVEILALYVQNRRLKRRLSTYLLQPPSQTANVATLPSRSDRKIEPVPVDDYPADSSGSKHL